jgi:hypothetical protein
MSRARVTPFAAAAILAATQSAVLPPRRIRRDLLPSSFAKSMRAGEFDGEPLDGPVVDGVRHDWFGSDTGHLMRVEVGPGASEIVIFSPEGNPIGIGIASTDPTARRGTEIADLKMSWRADPDWDIEETEGFELHAEELAAFARDEAVKAGKRRDAEWNAEVDRIAETLGTTSIRAIAERFLIMEKRITALAERIDEVERSR